MSLQSSIVLLLVLVGCTSLLVCGQSEVQKLVARSSDDESGIAEPEGASSGSREIYSHKHLSPHRMMHFGKRPLVAQPPEIFTTTNQVLDLYRRQPLPFDQEDQERQELPAASAYPFTVYFPMARSSDSIVQQSDSFMNPARDRQVLQVVQNLLGLPTKQRQQLLACDENLLNNQQQVQFRRQTSALARPKPMRLVAATVDGQQQQPADSSNGSNESLQTIYTAKKQSSSSNEAQQQQSEGGQQEQQDSSATSNGHSEGDEIDRSSRSVGPPRNFMNQRLMPAQFSMLLGGTPNSNSQASSLLNFIKKAEPQRMTFMHFGRRR